MTEEEEDMNYYEAAGDPDGAENLPVTTGASPAEDQIDEVLDLDTHEALTRDDEEGGK